MTAAPTTIKLKPAEANATGVKTRPNAFAPILSGPQHMLLGAQHAHFWNSETMKLRPYYRIEPAQWMFRDHPDVIEATRRALANPLADERTIEEYVRQWMLRELVETYNYPKEWLGERIIIEEAVKMGVGSKQADISIKNSGHKTYLYIETANASVKGREFDEKQGQLESYLAATHTATIGLVTNGLDTRVLEKKIDPNDFNLIPDIPGFGTTAKQRHVLIREIRPEDMKAGRKTGLDPITAKLEHILFECHSVIRDVDGLHDDEALDELSKLIFAKMYDERLTCQKPDGTPFRFQAYGASNTEEAASVVRDLYAEARDADMNSNAQKIIGYERSRGVFKGQIRLSSNALFRVIEKLQNYSFLDSKTDIKGRAFQKVLGAAIRAGMGQFFTPHEVVSLIIEMVDPNANDLILDPFCGSGHFLSQCIEHVETKHGHELDDYSRYDFRFNRLHGVEKSDRMVRIAMTDMLLHDDGHTNIRNTDAFLSFDNYPDLVALGGSENDSPQVFSKVLTNPPFGSIMQGEIGDILGRFSLGAKKKSLPLEYIAIERSLSFLKPGGTLAIVLPDGIITNSNAQFARSWIMSQAQIQAVISLPLETFGPYGTMTKTSVLILRKLNTDEVAKDDYTVFMADVSDIGYDATGRPTNGQDRQEIIRAWNTYKSGLQELGVAKERAYLTTAEKIQFRWDFKAGLIDTDDDYVEIGNYLTVARETRSLQKFKTETFPYVSVAELGNDDFLIRAEEIEKVAGPRLQGSKNIAKGGDVLFARLGPSMANRKSVLLDENVGQVYCSNEFHVLRPKEGIPSEYLLYLVKSETFITQARAKARGATPSRLRLHRDDLPKLRVPLHTDEERKQLGSRYLEGRKEAASLRKQANDLHSDVSPDF
ncbi:hypothetical protein NCCP1664_25140 [Zafaria cholistanensis]|uniref:Uncharacterized protein n=1 Tax=Zafaria cholistanensis TaxID=1682741 RepID=A0A5A7NTF2_9MICC|nr:N-6 DNA methylase [Zafaria cholistanensis]GER24019.1 hypothetical protein NCCP1664_25140 [Zafaria cholistanensis]